MRYGNDAKTAGCRRSINEGSESTGPVDDQDEGWARIGEIDPDDRPRPLRPLAYSAAGGPLGEFLWRR
jgi:hypothetical protein